MTDVHGSTLTERLDAINEFDREPVTEDHLQGAGNFIGLYAGEHVAGTEFVIGPLFVAHGVSAADLILGLLVGNFLAVLSWAFLCAPIAVRTRLNLYWKLRKIAGPNLLFFYNIVNALMFCFLAGAMIAVAATAVGIPFHIAMPGLSDLYPSTVGWVVTVLVVGAVVTFLAILGFKQIAQFSKVASPWVFLVFVACGVAVLPQLGVRSLGDFWTVANQKIWTGAPLAGRVHFTFWHIMFFSWFTNMAMHIGMADLTILRYAKKWQYGFFSAFGMYLGHYVAWIASGILVALAIQNAGEVAPGPIAYLGAGYAGLAGLFRKVWSMGKAGVEVPMTVYRDGRPVELTVTSGDRNRFLKGPSLH